MKKPSPSGGRGDRSNCAGNWGVGGITPSPELVARVMRALPIPVHVMIRPRAGISLQPGRDRADAGFDLPSREISDRSRSEGRKVEMDGVVFGALDAAGNVDAETCRRLIRLARSLRLSVTFHRAIDVARDPLQALRTSSRWGRSGTELRWRRIRLRGPLYPRSDARNLKSGTRPHPDAGPRRDGCELRGDRATTRAREIHGSRLEIIERPDLQKRTSPGSVDPRPWFPYSAGSRIVLRNSSGTPLLPAAISRRPPQRQVHGREHRRKPSGFLPAERNLRKSRAAASHPE